MKATLIALDAGIANLATQLSKSRVIQCFMERKSRYKSGLLQLPAKPKKSLSSHQ